ncbi:hypothetical protein FIBSPDRAFT_164711 [Athelia psychrophila]|uniref:Uncharacterized protein n=1 Tax=Athelia psychrophila TaxID=1759441 RepID=A0A166B6I3_9AGAM|nr:hypothetical protein FIBSPDRAFT_164711 [Fibularhizoctonia sp. CBS 109695]
MSLVTSNFISDFLAILSLSILFAGLALVCKLDAFFPASILGGCSWILSARRGGRSSVRHGNTLFRIYQYHVSSERHHRLPQPSITVTTGSGIEILFQRCLSSSTHLATESPAVICYYDDLPL